MFSSFVTELILQARNLGTLTIVFVVVGRQTELKSTKYGLPEVPVVITVDLYREKKWQPVLLDEVVCEWQTCVTDG